MQSGDRERLKWYTKWNISVSLFYSVDKALIVSLSCSHQRPRVSVHELHKQETLVSMNHSQGQEKTLCSNCAREGRKHQDNVSKMSKILKNYFRHSRKNNL